MKIHTTLVWFCAGHYEATVENLFSPYFRLLEKEVETDHNTVFMDDTKLESRTGRYTFYWWKSEAQREGKTLDTLRHRYRWCTCRDE